MPLWILGSSTYGARLAALLGLPYAFASHFPPNELLDPGDLPERIPAVAELEEPYAMAGVNVYAAETDAKTRRLFTTLQQACTNRLRGAGGPHPPPIDDIQDYWSPAEKTQASAMLAYAVVGSAETVRAGVEQFRELRASTS